MQVIQVPVSGDNEFFLIASRIKISSYDRIMAGDTAHDNPFRDINEHYSKGIYIYHTTSGYNYTPQMDQECADGLFNWSQNGTQHPDWSNTQNVPYYIKTSVSYDNDPSNGSLSNNDDKSVTNWFGIGKKHVSLGDDGTDRIFTNDQDIWTSRAWEGDRYDAWNVGYNELFSPYSSPSTKTWNNTNSGIFIWNYQSSGSGPVNLAYLKIYKTGEGGLSEDSILHLTPPSRPMGLRVLTCDSFPVINTYQRIKLRWNHNMEPDMSRVLSGDTAHVKKYIIYRSKSGSMDTVPPDAISYSENYYENIGTVYSSSYSTPEYIDSELVPTCVDALCGYSNCWSLYPVRYRVQAVDKYEDESVLSDFITTEAWNTDLGGFGGVLSPEGDNLLNVQNDNLPKEFALKQNYPNPFNPVTNIQYDLPKDRFVTIKIYDLTGREIAVLINEFKNAGRYSVSFDGLNFASGVYYYKIKAGDFEQVRKMILIK